MTETRTPTLPTLDEARAHLDAHRNPTYPDDWCYGPDRGMWRGGHVVHAGPDPDIDGCTVVIDGTWGLTRDELPALMAFLGAVYVASDPALTEDGDVS